LFGPPTRRDRLQPAPQFTRGNFYSVRLLVLWAENQATTSRHRLLICEQTSPGAQIITGRQLLEPCTAPRSRRIHDSVHGTRLLNSSKKFKRTVMWYGRGSSA